MEMSSQELNDTTASSPAQAQTQVPPEKGYDFSYHNLACPLMDFAKKIRLRRIHALPLQPRLCHVRHPRCTSRQRTYLF